MRIKLRPLKPRTRNRLFRLSVAVNVLLIAAAYAHPPVVIGLIILVCVGGLGFAFGLWVVRPPANARSLAQRNRHLNRRLDATQAKLEREQSRE